MNIEPRYWLKSPATESHNHHRNVNTCERVTKSLRVQSSDGNSKSSYPWASFLLEICRALSNIRSSAMYTLKTAMPISVGSHTSLAKDVDPFLCLCVFYYRPFRDIGKSPAQAVGLGRIRSPFTSQEWLLLSLFFPLLKYCSDFNPGRGPAPEMTLTMSLEYIHSTECED